MLYKTKGAVEKAAERGDLLVFEIEDLEASNPGLVTEHAKVAAYTAEINLRLMQAVAGFRYSTERNVSGGSGKIECLRDAEQRLIEAKQKGYFFDVSIFYRSIQQLTEIVKDNFECSLALLGYLKVSTLDVQRYGSAVHSRLPCLAMGYSRIQLKKARALAKSMRRSCRTGKNLAGKLEGILERIEKLKGFGVDKQDMIEEIRQIARSRGVDFVLKMASCARSQKKLKRLLYTAKLNANSLGVDISTQIRDIEASVLF